MQGGWGCYSLGLSSSNVSTVFPQEGESSYSGKKSLGEHRPRYESASQQQMELEIRVKHKDQNDGVDKTPKSKDRTEAMDIKLHTLLISQAWSTLLRKFPSHSLCIHLSIIIKA